MLFPLETEEQPQIPQLGAAGLAPQGGQETRLPLGGGDHLLFGFVIHQWKLERSPGWSCWAGRGTGLFWALSASGVIATPEVGPEHPTAHREGTNMA